MKKSIGKLFPTKNFGFLRVVAYHDALHVDVEFINTGYTTTAIAKHIRDGKVKDKLKTNIFNVAFVGTGDYKTRIAGKTTKEYRVWYNMIQRCYDAKFHIKHPTYRGCTVCDEWLNFQNFAKWFSANYVEGLHLDKDIKVKGNKLYSPNTCLFVSQTDNSIEANAENFSFISPSGVVTKVYNLRQFCRDNNLNTGHMSRVHTGKLNQHKKWRKSCVST